MHLSKFPNGDLVLRGYEPAALLLASNTGYRQSTAMACLPYRGGPAQQLRARTIFEVRTTMRRSQTAKVIVVRQVVYFCRCKRLAIVTIFLTAISLAPFYNQPRLFLDFLFPSILCGNRYGNSVIPSRTSHIAQPLSLRFLYSIKLAWENTACGVCVI